MKYTPKIFFFIDSNKKLRKIIHTMFMLCNHMMNQMLRGLKN